MTLTATAVETAATPRFSGRERAILLVLLGAGFMLSVDFSILNVALPIAGAGVGLGTEGLPWITTAFALPAAGFTLLFGRLSDVYGRLRFFLSAMVVLTLASLLGGFATNPETLLTARVLQGFATAMAIPTGLALLTTAFPEGPRRERVLGLNGALLSGGFTVGALVGGLLVSALGWRAAFFINVPVAVTVLRRPTVKWGNYAGLVIFGMEPAMIFLITLYLQNVLHLSPLQTGLVFGVPGQSRIPAAPGR